MNIDVLLMGEDETYIKRLTDIIKRVKPKTGDSLNISMFTDVGKFRASTGEKRGGGKARYHIALIDEKADVGGIDFGDALVVLLTEEIGRNNGDYPIGTGTGSGTGTGNGRTALCLYKYQRVSGIVDAVIVKYARERDIYKKDKKGGASVYAFFSPQGGGGTSTVSAAYALALARAGVKPLYASFEFFNSTELFFSDQNGAAQGLSEIFSIIAGIAGVAGIIGITGRENAPAAIDAIKNTDPRGVSFLKKFALWTEVAEIRPDEMREFIESARAANGIGAVVLDLGSAYLQFTAAALECADEVFLVADVQGFWYRKLEALLSGRAPFTDVYGDKTGIIFNRSHGRERYAGFNAKKIAYVRTFAIERPAALIDSIAVELAGSMTNQR